MIKRTVFFKVFLCTFFLLLSCSDDLPLLDYDPNNPNYIPPSSSSNSGENGVMLPKRAEPFATSKNPEQPVILDSWKQEDKNWYIIDAGYIDNSLVMETDHEGYQGLVEMKFTTTQSVKESMSKSRTQNVSENISVSNNLGSIVGIEVGIKNTLKIGGSVWTLKVDDALETPLKANAQPSIFVSPSQGRTVQTSEVLATGLETTITNTISYTLDKNTPVGYYRYAWYATNDVYFVISTSLDNQELLSWDVVSCTRPTLTKVFEYSPENKFDNSPKEGTEIVFAEDFYKNLKTPTKDISQSSSSSVAESSSSSATESSSSSSSVAESSSSEVSDLCAEFDPKAEVEHYGKNKKQICDARDGKTYSIVVIGTQTWMAENLNYAPESGTFWCYDGDEANCTTYGRLYDWATALTVCPTDWYLPSDAEWTTLIDYVGGSSTAGTKLKASSGWDAYNGIHFGTDDYGFSALPGGRGISGSDFSNVGNSGSWWSATEFSAIYANTTTMNNNSEYANTGITNKVNFRSVRCLRD
ncbi:hypothetical protein AGMMS49938_12870 [Fibrobacterales bacterium]|nr:hypothetical protein AGMMS49938_12870 [Fibrobacterales bacterium]